MAASKNSLDRESANSRAPKVHRTYTRAMALDVFDAASLLVNEATGRAQSPFYEEKEDPSVVIGNGDDGKLLFADHRDADRPFKDWIDWMDGFLDGNEVSLNGDRQPQEKEPYPARTKADLRARKAALGKSKALKDLEERGVSHETARDWNLGACKANVLDPVSGEANASGGSYVCLSSPYHRDGAEVGIQGVRPDPNAPKGSKVLAHGERELTHAKPLKGQALLTEGLTDGMSGHEMGFTAVAAPSASTWKKHYAAQFEDCTQVVIIYDWDAAGRKGAKRAAKAISEFVHDVRILDLSEVLELDLEEDDGFDLNDLLVGMGADAARDLINLAIKETEPEAAIGGVSEVEGVEPEEERHSFNLTDLGNAQRFAKRERGRLLHVPEMGRWYRWTGKYWAEAKVLEQEAAAKDTVKSIYAEVSEIDNQKERKELAEWARKSETRAHIDATLRLGRSEPGIVGSVDTLDRDTGSINVQNGILDLSTFELHPHDADARHTKIAGAGYYPEAKYPRWERFLERVVPDVEVREFLQRAAGMSLLGSYSEYLLFLYGTGRNGKTRLLEALRDAFGDYSVAAAPDLLIEKRFDRGAADAAAIADLRGSRFVTTIEAGQAKQLAEALVKSLTGETTLKARFMRQDWWEFENRAAIWLAANHKPHISGTDEGIWARIVVTPFTVTIPEDERDGELADKLRKELDGIFAWAVEGLRQYREIGLDPPEAVRAATNEYRREMDQIGAWVESECKIEQKGWASTADLRKSYRHYCEEAGETAFSNVDLRNHLRDALGCEAHRGTGGVAGWNGITLERENWHSAKKGGR